VGVFHSGIVQEFGDRYFEFRGSHSHEFMLVWLQLDLQGYVFARRLLDSFFSGHLAPRFVIANGKIIPEGPFGPFRLMR
jgi:hypothetical protein